VYKERLVPPARPSKKAKKAKKKQRVQSAAEREKCVADIRMG
jgi:hypothetical protein